MLCPGVYLCCETAEGQQIIPHTEGYKIKVVAAPNTISLVHYLQNCSFSCKFSEYSCCKNAK